MYDLAVCQVFIYFENDGDRYVNQKMLLPTAVE